MDPVLIVGAGIVGLTLGQALKQKNIPFEIYERDANPEARGQGWAITLHWALEYLEKMLPQETLARIQDVQVDPDVARNDSGNFLFINLETGQPKFKIPPNRRWRVNREKMRRALLHGIEDHVHWGRRVTTVKGRLVVGIDGSRSMIRQVLRPDAFENVPLGINFTGAAVDFTPEEIKPLKEMDPLLFQGCYPPTGTFFWFSMLETPQINGTAGTKDERYRAQICMSWSERGPEDKVGATDEYRLANMKQRAQGFVPFLQRAVDRIPVGTPVTEIKLADWECLGWDNQGGRVTLAGDAAHAMTMYRGEAANHGLLDAYRLMEAIEQIHSGSAIASEAIDRCEREMRDRTSHAVRLSRQACRDAHDWGRLDETSAILTKRAVFAK
ncbi:putative FAD-dependent monooxygenase [Penicillium chrysogenum]|uniref:Putative FAD-dependent monooxygenase n=1 Tax=Penicillium chrysogenum TaxID=5076 RepID=A0A167PRF8_PENCH|nr:putative FAD-dependent monooxygenase [Penicillium chrysogenum]